MADQSAQYRAKQPRTVLAGPYGHPFHPILITLPIGAWIAAVIFDVAAMITGEPQVFERGAVWLTAIGIVGALVAALFGFMDYGQIAGRTKAKKTATIHMLLNLVAVVVFAVAFLLRMAAGYDEISVEGFIISLVGLGLISASGYLGGMLAYHFGVRVADEQKQSEGWETP